MSIIKIWKSRNQILEGIKNSIFKREDIEEIAHDRLEVCRGCESYDTSGDGCIIPGTQPCCNMQNGGCGCSLHLKTRSLSSDCPKAKWHAILDSDEEDALKEKLGL